MGADSLSASPTSGRTVGRYVLFDEIAAGGMATVHLGRLVGPVGFSRTVAIKRLHPQYAKDAEFVAMFLDEARLAARIRHPNVVPTLDVVQAEDELLLVMEYVQGESLSKLIRRGTATGKPAPLPILATILSGVLHGLHAAHEAKGEKGEPLDIVHRDVSPQNILVGIDGTPRLLDFGVAKATQRSQSTRDGQVKGKLAYMAPEQITSDSVDRRADIFSAGVVLWEALTGDRLFAGLTDARVMSKILHEEVQRPSAIASRVPPAFDAICMRALARDPSDRQATAREMALAIEQASALAPASEIGTWVDGLAHDAIEARAARVHEIESRSNVFAKPLPVDSGRWDLASATRRPKRTGRTALVAALVLIVVGGAAAGGYVVASRKAPAVAERVVTTPPPATPEPRPTTNAAPPETSHADVAETASAAQPVPIAKTTRKAAPTASANPCAHPFVIDSSGIKHVRPECL